MRGDDRLPHAHEAGGGAVAPDALGAHPGAFEQQEQFVGQKLRLFERRGAAQPDQAVALAAGPPPRVVTFGEVAPVAMMLGSADLLRAWVLATLGGLATDDEHHARLRDTLLVFLRSGGIYKATAEQLVLHKNTVQYRIHKAEESLGRPAAEHRDDVELALRVTRWLGSSVLPPAR